MISNILSNSFLLTALIASFLASIASAITGSFIVIKRISSISGSIAHSVLGGMSPGADQGQRGGAAHYQRHQSQRSVHSPSDVPPRV